MTLNKAIKDAKELTEHTHHDHMIVRREGLIEIISYLEYCTIDFNDANNQCTELAAVYFQNDGTFVTYAE